MDFNGQVKGNGLPTGNVIDGDLDMGAYLIRMQDNVIIGSGNNALQLTKNSSSVILDDTLAHISAVQGSISLSALNDINLNPSNGSVKVNGTVLGGGPQFKKYGFPAGVGLKPFYSDTNITFGWDAPGNDIECHILTMPSNDGLRASAFLHGTFQDQRTVMLGANTLYDLFTPGITQGEVCEIVVSAYDDNTYPIYKLTVHNTGSSSNVNVVVEIIS